MITRKLEPGDVIFVKRKVKSSLFDRICQSVIRWATGSPYFHVAYYVDESSAFEANGFRTAGMAAISDYAEYDVKRLAFPFEVRERILKRIMLTGGSCYGWGEIISLALRLKVGIRIYYDDPSRFICSEELAAAVYMETGIRIVDQTTTDVSPADLWQSEYLIEV
jgi:hypothetical protein